MAIYVPVRVRGWSSFIQGCLQYLAKQSPIAGAELTISQVAKTDTGTYHST